MLVGGGKDLAFPEQLLDRADVIISDDRYLTGLAGLLDCFERAESHAVVRAEQRLDVGMRGDDVACDAVCLVRLPIGGL